MAKRRRRRGKKMNRFTIFCALVLTVVFGSIFTFKIFELKSQSREYAIQLEQLKKQRDEQKARDAELDEFEDYVGTDEYVEDVAREKLGLVYKDEILFKPEDGK